MAKRTTGGRKSKSSKSKAASVSDVVESSATDVTDEVTAKASDVSDAIDDITTPDVSVDDASADVLGSETVAEAEAPEIKSEEDLDASKSDDALPVDEPSSASDADEIVYTTPAAAAAPVVVRKGGFFPMLLGGAVAAGLGFAAAESDVLEPILPASWQDDDQATSVDLTALTEQIETQSALIAALEEKVGAMPAPDLSAIDANATAIEGISSEIETLSGSFGTVTDTVGALDERLTTLEKAPIADAVSPAAIEAYERELAAVVEKAATAESEANEARAAELAALAASVAAQRDEIDQVLANAKAVEEEANAAAKTAEIKLALSNVVSAIDAGDPFESELDILAAAGGPDVPDALKAVAETGLPTLAALQDSFPSLARQALAAAPPAEGSSGLGSILQRSLGARSTTPREGDDPDAILSRAEAALKDGDVETTLSEVEKLPDGSKTVMADWLAQAAARLEARTAADALAASLNTN